MTVHRSKLVPHPENPRMIDDYARKGLRESIKQFGMVQPIVWNIRTGHVVGGHQRLTETDELQGTADYELKVAKVDLSEDDEKKLLLVLNAESIQGVWDIDRFTGIAESLGLSGLAEAGFGIADVEGLYADHGLGLPAFISGETEDEQDATDDAIREINDFADEVADDKAHEKADKDATKRQERSQAEIDEYKDKKKNFAEKQAFQSEFAAHLMVQFPTNDSAAVFLEAMGLPPESQWIDGVELARRLDIDLKLPEPEPEPAKKSRKK